LYDRIVAAGLYPVTTLTTLKQSEKKLLINQGVVTSAMIPNRRDALRAIGIPSERIGAILSETQTLIEPFDYA
jgi:hypothetical protein